MRTTTTIIATYIAGVLSATAILPGSNGETLPPIVSSIDPDERIEEPTLVMSDLEEAVWTVETNQGSGPIVGDGGRSLGPLQCGRLAYLDACEYDPTLAARPYEDVVDLAYAVRVFRAYTDRWAGPDADDVTKARVWNGGSKGARKQATLSYARKIDAILGR